MSSETSSTSSSSPPELLQTPHEQPVEGVLRGVWNRLNTRNEHFVSAIVGREGSGKSHTAIKLASTIDEDFSTDQVIFRPQEFLRVLRDDEYQEGAVFVLDEAGVGFGSRTWQDRAQVHANQALQLIRSHNVGLIFTLPRLSELDSQTQGRLHAFLEIVEKEDGEYVRAKWKWLDPDRADSTGEIYKKYPRDSLGRRVTSFRFTPPSEELLEPYEERKSAFQAEMYERSIEELAPDEDDDNELSDDDIIANVLEDPEEYTKSINNGAQEVLDRALIESKHDVGRKRSKRVKSQVLAELDRELI